MSSKWMERSSICTDTTISNSPKEEDDDVKAESSSKRKPASKRKVGSRAWPILADSPTDTIMGNASSQAKKEASEDEDSLSALSSEEEEKKPAKRAKVSGLCGSIFIISVKA
jgi:hypothetical protein